MSDAAAVPPLTDAMRACVAADQTAFDAACESALTHLGRSHAGRPILDQARAAYAAGERREAHGRLWQVMTSLVWTFPPDASVLPQFLDWHCPTCTTDYFLPSYCPADGTPLDHIRQD